MVVFDEFAGMSLMDARGRLDAVRYLFVLTLGLTVVSALHYVYLASTGRTGTSPT